MMELDVVLRRVRAEFAEMPGLRLTPAQASRLLGIERNACQAVIEALIESGAPWQADPPDGFPVAPDAAGYIRLFPHVHGTDGFTAIRLRRLP